MTPTSRRGAAALALASAVNRLNDADVKMRHAARVGDEEFVINAADEWCRVLDDVQDLRDNYARINFGEKLADRVADHLIVRGSFAEVSAKDQLVAEIKEALT